MTVLRFISTILNGAARFTDSSTRFMCLAADGAHNATSVALTSSLLDQLRDAKDNGVPAEVLVEQLILDEPVKQAVLKALK